MRRSTTPVRKRRGPPWRLPQLSRAVSDAGWPYPLRCSAGHAGRARLSAGSADPVSNTVHWMGAGRWSILVQGRTASDLVRVRVTTARVADANIAVRAELASRADVVVFGEGVQRPLGRAVELKATPVEALVRCWTAGRWRKGGPGSPPLLRLPYCRMSERTRRAKRETPRRQEHVPCTIVSCELRTALGVNPRQIGTSRVPVGPIMIRRQRSYGESMLMWCRGPLPKNRAKCCPRTPCSTSQ